MPMKLDLSDEETTVLKGVLGRLNAPLLDIALRMNGEDYTESDYEMSVILKIYKRL